MTTRWRQSCQLILIYLHETSTRYGLTWIWYPISGFYCSGFGVPIFCFPLFCRSWFYYMLFFHDANKTLHWSAANMIGGRFFKIFYWVFQYEKTGIFPSTFVFHRLAERLSFFKFSCFLLAITKWKSVKQTYLNLFWRVSFEFL